MLKDSIISWLKPKDKAEKPAKRPLFQSYQVSEHLWAGEYPGDKGEEKAKDKLQQLLQFGVRYFVDLTEEGELVPYDRLLPTNATHHRFPIRDVSAPKSIDEAKQIVDYILSFATKGQYGDVYVHCWGGVGRTGTIIACVIAEQMEYPQFDAASKGTVMVSPFISRDEQEVLHALLNDNHYIIYLSDNGFGNYFKPSNLLFDAVAAGRLLILSPWTHNPDKRTITRAECVALNQMAEEISAR